MTFAPFLSRRDVMTAAAALAAVAPAPRLLAKDQPVPAPERGTAPGVTVKGTVFESRTGALERQGGDPGLAGIMVSNGREIVRTDADGTYSLPAEDGTAIFVIKPSGYKVPLDAATRLPRFSYIHQPEGTPETLGLLYPGLRPSGPLPSSVDFGLTKAEEPGQFDAVLFADPQPESQAETDFIREDIANALIGVEAAFGITAGDIMFDDLSLYGRYNRIIGQIGIPWWNIGGNHDLNFEAPDSRYSRETYKRIFGPNYYAFEYGNTLFLMLDNVDYLGADPSKPRSAGKYRGFFGERQLAFIANVLRETPKERLVAAFTHIPLRNYLDPNDPTTNVADRAEFLRARRAQCGELFRPHPHDRTSLFWPGGGI